jgi:hypothetical protein
MMPIIPGLRTMAFVRGSREHPFFDVFAIRATRLAASCGQLDRAVVFSDQTYLRITLAGFAQSLVGQSLVGPALDNGVGTRVVIMIRSMSPMAHQFC